MAFDGFVTRAVVHELKENIVGGRITKIHQPHHTDLVFQIRTPKGNVRLLMSANPTYPRVHLTTEEFVNPTEAPMFCMLLRKYCEGGTIEEISQVDMERIIHIHVRRRDELGDTSYKRIVVEIMGRHSNIILMDPLTHTIIDSAQHVTHAVSQYRQVLPGRPYVAPPQQGKQNPLAVDQDRFISALDWNAGKWDRQLVNAFTGLSPLLAQEIVHRAGLLTREALWHSFSQLMEQMAAHRYQPVIVHTREKSYFSCTALTHVPDTQQTLSYPGISECLQAFYAEKSRRDVVKQRVTDLIRIVSTEKQKNEKKIEKLHLTLTEAQEAETFRLYGELITAHLHQMKKGDTQLIAVNWYDENGSTVTIPLDPLKSPTENMQAYYKKYNKAKNSVEFVQEQIRQAEEEIRYLDGLLVQLELATLEQAEEIREEMVEQGYLRDRSRRQGKKKKNGGPEPEVFYSSEGIPILVGKNNKQNDYLTNKLAASTDTWLHTKDIPGSHVVIRSRQYGDQTLLEAANLAVYFSKAKNSSLVPVDYTLVKHVKKPSGSKPGFCIYEQQKTLYITPDEALIERIKTNRPTGEMERKEGRPLS